MLRFSDGLRAAEAPNVRVCDTFIFLEICLKMEDEKFSKFYLLRTVIQNIIVKYLLCVVVLQSVVVCWENDTGDKEKSILSKISLKQKIRYNVIICNNNIMCNNTVYARLN